MRIFEVFRNIAKKADSVFDLFKILTRFFKYQVNIRYLNKGGLVLPWINNSTFFVTQGAHGLTGNIYFGFSEKEMIFFLKTISNKDVFFDIGANRGAYTILASKVIGCRTYSFEPSLNTFEDLQKNLTINNINSLVKPFNMGVSSDNKSLFFSTDLDTRNSIVNEEYKGEKQKMMFEKLDRLVAKYEAPSIVKIDVEGFELDVLTGGEALIKSGLVKYFIIEDTEFDLNGNVKSIMKKNGYNAYGFDGKTLVELSKQANYFNVIYIKSKDLSGLKNSLISSDKKYFNHFLKKFV